LTFAPNRVLDPCRELRHDSPVISIANIVADAPGDGMVVDPMDWFDSPGPLEVEIGCGKGGFLLSRARANPHVRFLGIEWAAKFHRYAADRFARWQVANVRILRTDAKVFFERNLRAECVTVLHLYHPDPWPKKRHHKRRLVQAVFVEAAVRVLVAGGRWLVQSDHEEYFDQIRRLLDARPDLEEIEWSDANAGAGADWIGTNFEIKYTREERLIRRAAYRKRSVETGPNQR